MALWQLSFQIVDREHINFRNEEEMYVWNKQRVITANMYYSLEKAMKVGKTWTEKLLVLGNLEDTAVEIFTVGENTVEISCKYSVIQYDEECTKLILSYISEIDGMILYMNQFYEPKLDVFINLIKTSEAAKFVTQQENYFSK